MGLLPNVLFSIYQLSPLLGQELCEDRDCVVLSTNVSLTPGTGSSPMKGGMKSAEEGESLRAQGSRRLRRLLIRLGPKRLVRNGW